MAIVTNTSFDTQNLELIKRPLFLVVIEGLPEPFTTFRLDQAQVVRHGYGLAGYGLTGYGF